MTFFLVQHQSAGNVSDLELTSCTDITGYSSSTPTYQNTLANERSFSSHYFFYKLWFLWLSDEAFCHFCYFTSCFTSSVTSCRNRYKLIFDHTNEDLGSDFCVRYPGWWSPPLEPKEHLRAFETCSLTVYLLFSAPEILKTAVLDISGRFSEVSWEPMSTIRLSWETCSKPNPSPIFCNL